jgi:hypothetical protein
MNKQKVVEWVGRGLIGLLSIFATVLITALLQGGSLGSLIKMAVFWNVLKSQSIPVWLFVLVLIAAFFGIQGTVAAAQKHKKVLHIVWNEKNSSWHMGSARGKPAMQVMVDAIFTGTEPDSIQILIAGVEGGKTESNLIPIICPENQPVRGKVMFFVQPPVAKEGKPWRGRIVLVDQYNRKFRSPKLTLENR